MTLKEGQSQLVGVQVLHSKKKAQDYIIAHFLEPIPKENGNGFKTFSTFVPDSVKLPPTNSVCEVYFDRNGYLKFVNPVVED